MNNFDISFKWIGAATWILRVDNLHFACDPILCKKNTIIDLKYFNGKRRIAPNYTKEDFNKTDYWFLTHNHADHIDQEGISVISPTSHIFSHANMKSWFKNNQKHKITYLSWREKYFLTKDPIRIVVEAIPCVHGSNSISRILTGHGNGYWVKLTKNNNTLDIYITGDTIYHSKVIKHISQRKADILIPNMGGSGLDKFGGPFTFTADILNRFLNVLNPKAILPVHHNTFSIYKESISMLYKLNDPRVIKFTEGEKVYL